MPDERLTKLAELVHLGRIVPATCEIVDIAGLVKGASKGEGLGNKSLGNIRETDAIIHVLRCFEDENITHVDGTINPIRDKEIIDTELQLKDLETIESRYTKTQKVASTGNKDAKVELAVLTAYKECLEQGKNARTVEFESKEEQQAAKNLFLLTSKPVLYVCNVSEGDAKDGNEWTKKSTPSQRRRAPSQWWWQQRRKRTSPDLTAMRTSSCSWRNWGWRRAA